MIKTLQQLYKALDDLLVGVSKACKQCSYDDCKGYIWLLPEESLRLFEADIPILEINKSISFISPFKDEEIDVERFKPDCPWCKKRKCTIRELRPLSCRMYPLCFLQKDGIVYLVLHLDCRYAQERKDDQEFKSKAQDLLQSIDPELMKLILDIYLSYESVTRFPFGPNRCQILAPIAKQKGGKAIMSKCKAVMDSAKVTSLVIKRKPKAQPAAKKKTASK